MYQHDLAEYWTLDLCPRALPRLVDQVVLFA
jgi:hypothetical protein